MSTITKWSDFIITNSGLALRQKAIALGLQVRFVYAEVGEGVPADPSLIPIMTSLVLFKERAGIARSASGEATHHVDIIVDNLRFEESFPMREQAVYARIEQPEDPESTALLDPELEGFFEPVLYGYAYTLNGYESVPAGKQQHRLWTIGVDTLISRSMEITIVYDGSNVYVNNDQIDPILKVAQGAYELLLNFDEKTLARGMVNPTPTTVGRLNQFYLNVLTGALFACILKNGEQHVWLPVAECLGGGSLSDLTFNGMPLDNFFSTLMFTLSGIRSELDLIAATVNAGEDFSAWLGSAYLGAMYLGAE